MVASVVSAQMGADSGDGGLFWAVLGVPTAYVPGEILPPDAVVGTPPVVTIVSPTTNTRIARAAPLVLDVVDPDGLTLARLMIRSGGASARWEQAYKDSAACVGFAVTRTAIADGYRYEITRDGGWNPGGLDLEPVFGDPTATGSINT